MLRHRKSTLAILSFSFSSLAFANGISVKVPIAVFHRRPWVPVPLSATLWLAKNHAKATMGRAVLVLRGPGGGPSGRKTDYVKDEQAMADAGFNVLALDTRDNSAKILKM